MKVIFLDRDGVINKFPGREKYVTHMKEFHLLPQALEAIRLFTKNKFKIFIVSNQGCISRGLITRKELSRITKHMKDKVMRRGGKIHGVFYCEHQTSDKCGCKKPKVELFKKAIAGKRVRLSATYFIGDSKEDIQAAKNLGCGSILVLSGRTKKKELMSFYPKPDFIKKNLLEAAHWITQKKS